MQPRSVAPGPDEQPAAGALLHLRCELASGLRPLLLQWWEQFHYAELLTLPGFLWARRGHLIAPDGQPPIVTMYGIADPAAADQPRPPEFTLLPSELVGKVTFHRSILRRTSSPGATETFGPAFLQLLSPVGGADVHVAAARVSQWPGVLSVTCWRSVANTPHTSREEVVHQRDTELIQAELTDDSGALELLSQAATELPSWGASVYRQTFPARQPV